jgi:hypothetical protein
MYAVIRAGGKQYRVAPGDVIRVEKLATGTDGHVNFPEVLAVSGGEGTVGCTRSRPSGGGRPRREDFGFPLQAEEAVQEAARTPAGLHRSADQRDRLRWAELQGSRRREEGAQGEEAGGYRRARA